MEIQVTIEHEGQTYTAKIDEKGGNKHFMAKIKQAIDNGKDPIEALVFLAKKGVGGICPLSEDYEEVIKHLGQYIAQ